jgi:DNA repair exonuclease SbcCD ATPase subunit
MKSREEVEELKRQWLRDPAFDLAEVEGFEDYEEELRRFESENAEVRNRANLARWTRIAEWMGMPGKIAFAEWMEKTVLWQLEELGDEIDQLEGQIDAMRRGEEDLAEIRGRLQHARERGDAVRRAYGGE